MSEPFTKEQLQQGLARSPFIAFMGLEVLQADPANQAVTMRMAMRPEFERGKDTKQWHGGPIAAMIDTVGDYALVMTSAPAAADHQLPRRLSPPGGRHSAYCHGACQEGRQECRRRGYRRVRRQAKPCRDRPRDLFHARRLTGQFPRDACCKRTRIARDTYCSKRIQPGSLGSGPSPKLAHFSDMPRQA